MFRKILPKFADKSHLRYTGGSSLFAQRPAKPSKRSPPTTVWQCRVAEWKSDRATYLARCNDLPRSRTRRGKASRDLCRLLTECLQAQPGRGLPVVSILLPSSCFSFSLSFFSLSLSSSSFCCFHFVVVTSFLRDFSLRFFSMFPFPSPSSLNFSPLEKMRGKEAVPSKLLW